MCGLCPYSNWRTSNENALFSGANAQRLGNSVRVVIALSNASHQRRPVSPAYCEISHSRIASESFSACAVTSTRKVMFPTQVREDLCGRSCPFSSQIFRTTSNTLRSFRKILPFPLEIGRESLVQSSFRVLAAPPGVFFQFRFALRFDRHQFHSSSIVLTFVILLHIEKISESRPLNF